MTEDDGTDIDGYHHDETEALVEERYASASSATNSFINWSVIFDGVPSQHLKLLALICALLAFTTVFNIASARYSIEHQKMLTEMQPNHNVDAFTNTNDHTKLLEVSQPKDTLQKLQQLRASSPSSQERLEEEDSPSSRSTTVSHGSLEEDLFSAGASESDFETKPAMEEEGERDDQTQKRRDELISQYKAGKDQTKISSMRQKFSDNSDGTPSVNNFSSDEDDSAGRLESMKNPKEEVLLDNKKVTERDPQVHTTDASQKEFTSLSTPTDNIDVEISTSLQQQTAMIQKLQEQLEQQQSMMESIRQKRGGTENIPQDPNAVYSRQGTPPASFGWMPQQQPNFYSQQTTPVYSGTLVAPQEAAPYQPQQPNYPHDFSPVMQQKQHPFSAVPLAGGLGTSPLMNLSQQQPDGTFLMPPTGVAGSSSQMYQSQQQPDGTLLMPPTGVAGSSSQMYQSQQQPDGTFLMPPTGALGINAQMYQSQQQPESVMQYSNTAVTMTSSAPTSFSDSDVLSGYKDTWDPHEETDTPVFWHVPKAGGSTVKDIMGTCHRMTMASEAGIAEGHGEETVSSLFLIDE